MVAESSNIALAVGAESEIETFKYRKDAARDRMLCFHTLLYTRRCDSKLRVTFVPPHRRLRLVYARSVSRLAYHVHKLKLKEELTLKIR